MHSSQTDHSLTILVIDDDEFYGKALIRELSAGGHYASAVRELSQALIELSNGFCPDLILTDRHVEGHVVDYRLDELRRAAPRARIVIYTLNHEMTIDEVDQLRARGADRIISKRGDDVAQIVDEMSRIGWLTRNDVKTQAEVGTPFLVHAALSREQLLAITPMPEYFVWWFDIEDADVHAFACRLEIAQSEQDLQSFLEENPMLLIQHLGGGHGRWVVPRQRLGAEHVTDFMIGERHSLGFEWQAVELESPKATMFTRSGDPSHHLTHAIRQIQDWRAWLLRNQNYAARSREESGLGLTDIVANVPGLILIGRRDAVDERTRDRRRQMSNDLGIKIHSYDFLLDAGRGRVGSLKYCRPSAK